MLSVSYDSITIEVTTQEGNLELTSNYSLTKNGSQYEVTYSKERYNTFDTTTNAELTEMISVEEGTTTISSEESIFNKFTVNRTSYNTIKIDSTSFHGNMDNAKTYLEVDYNCNDFEIEIAYTSSINSIQYQYVLDDSTTCRVQYMVK